MLKRTKSYLLLSLLVITGFAGKIHSDAISGKERKVLVNELKDTKKVFLQSVKGLSEAQLNFKPSAEAWSVKECAYHLALSENNLWKMAEGSLKAPANPEKRAEIKMTDEQIMKMMKDRRNKIKTNESFEPVKATYKNLEEALNDFKLKRADLIKFVKTSTDDMRNHVAQGPMGSIDSYQILMLLATHTNRHTQQIEEVKANPNFPK